MSVIKVLSTNSVAAGTEYQTVETGFYRVIATAGDATIKFNDGPAIKILQDEALLINSGVKPGAARILKATDSATSVYTLGHNLGEIGNTHPFSTGDFIAVVDDGTSPAINSNFLSAGTAGKKITASTGSTITTDVDASGASADYTFAYSGPQAIVRRAVKITVATQTCIVEEIQVMG